MQQANTQTNGDATSAAEQRLPDKDDEHRELPRIGVVAESFTVNLDALRHFVDTLTPIAAERDRAAVTRLTDGLEAIFRSCGFDDEALAAVKRGEKHQVKMSSQQALKFLDDVRQLASPHNRPMAASTVLLLKSAFVMLNAHFDYLLADVMKCYFTMFPKSLPGQELSLSLAELRVCASLGEAVELLVCRQVDRFTYQSLAEQREELTKRTGAEWYDGLTNWPLIDEAVQRRNLIVHNNCIVNRKYLDCTSGYRRADGSVPELGAELDVSLDYFGAIHDELLLAGIGLTQCCWRKWAKQSTDAADSALIMAMYKTLLSERWLLAERMGRLADRFAHANTSNSLMLKVNYCIALRELGKADELATETRKLDPSALSPKFKLAIAALMDDREECYRLLPACIEVDGVSRSEVEEWPLLRRLRLDPDFSLRIARAFEDAPPQHPVGSLNQSAPALPSPMTTE